MLEQVSEESGSVLGEINEEIIAEAMATKRIYGTKLIRQSYVTRLFRQRMLRIKIGEFRKIEAGFTLEYFQSTADNIVTYIYMVNPTSQMSLL